jgi:hypothetical protein
MLCYFLHVMRCFHKKLCGQLQTVFSPVSRVSNKYCMNESKMPMNVLRHKKELDVSRLASGM